MRVHIIVLLVFVFVVDYCLLLVLLFVFFVVHNCLLVLVHKTDSGKKNARCQTYCLCCFTTCVLICYVVFIIFICCCLLLFMSCCSQNRLRQKTPAGKLIVWHTYNVLWVFAHPPTAYAVCGTCAIHTMSCRCLCIGTHLCCVCNVCNTYHVLWVFVH